MANDKFYGFQPKYKDGVKSTALLDTLNPYEFKKGMDYELTELGCLRLKESTVEEREKATESVLKKLEEYPSYYSCLIHYETEFRNVDKKPAWKTWLKEFHEENSMKEIDKKYKNDKMVEPKLNDLNTIKMKTLHPLSEAIKKEIQSALNEQDDKEDEEVTAVKATKGAKKAEKGMARFDKEEKAIDELLFGKEKENEEVDEENPGRGSLLFLKDKHIEIYKKDKDVEKYKKSIGLPDNISKKLEKHAEFFSKLGNNVKSADIKGKDIPDTIKKLEIRRGVINKERQEAQSEVGRQRNEIASTSMSRANHLRLLEICREHGVSLREGADNIRIYYEIAKQSFLEGLSKGLKL